MEILEEKTVPFWEAYGTIEDQRKRIIEFVNECDNIVSMSAISKIIELASVQAVE